VRHAHNSLCYSRKLHPFVQYRPFQAYCTCLYGCELWLLTNCNIDALCVDWRKTLPRIWNLPSCMHSRLVHLICNCLPLFDEIYRRSLHFIRTCALHNSPLIRFVVQYGASYARSQSILGQHVLFCTQCYHRSINDVVYYQVNSCISSFAYNYVECETHLATNLLAEALTLTLVLQMGETPLEHSLLRNFFV